MTTTSSKTKTLERNVEGRRYTVTYIEPIFDREERKRKEKEDVEHKLYDIFSKYYTNKTNSSAIKKGH